VDVAALGAGEGASVVKPADRGQVLVEHRVVTPGGVVQEQGEVIAAQQDVKQLEAHTVGCDAPQVGAGGRY
jgi:hypothetical protein